ncbi:dihydrolipoyllysine-residue acetyltransferase [Usitatibacter palustris]|uniref:Dihydrolipoamide acetyltransferase component of pyruvate dehydrogenase complex n=1 Tax=Usitatibacter palustris TaxID=2732487 RepID=A0A6M4H859_9PROT|nr:dihydrolipoyllysine-residue acetyltransferase [Usitatibacter palustris]QJR14564.1 Dihydrolipoyllysine-residue acetyltransferase component of pyruvate dehydrogenase complex [Usitatibacter palustris]
MSAIEIKVPDIGDFKDVPVIELLVKPGDAVKKDDSLVVLESDKATMEVPSPIAGVVREWKVKVGDSVSEGTLILTIDGVAAAAKPAPAPAPAPAAKAAPMPAPKLAEVPKPATPPAAAPAPAPAAKAAAPAAPSPTPAPAPAPATAPVQQAPLPAREGAVPAHASPGVRRFARELGVDVGRVKGSGPKARILKEDIQSYVKTALAGGLATPAPAAAKGGGLSDLGLPAWPKVDYAKFGPIEAKPLSRIQKISGPALARNWVMIPHVTQFDEADITELEAFRVRVNEENAKSGQKITMLAFLIKASVAALKKFPAFNSSLDGDNLVFKNYWNVGFAADTPNGLVVPVIKNADQKGVNDIARETSELAAKARDGKLGPADMQGGTFSISSLGGIGGTMFTPIINAPEVAILGVSKSAMKPVWDGKAFAPRLMLPLSLSYDHRVIDGASAARFTAYLGQVLADMRRVVL